MSGEAGATCPASRLTARDPGPSPFPSVHKPNHNYRRLRTAPTVVRIAIGLLLILGGIFGFLPVLGFWMIPLGLIVILIDVPAVKRLASRGRDWWRQRVGRTRAPRR